MLEKFRLAQLPRIERLQALEKSGALPAPYPGHRPSLAAGLRAVGPGALIAEYKRASPSAGAINLSLSPEETALAYASAGAAAISVLTEEVYFQGDIAYLQRMLAPGLPLLRKDFLIHPLQARETAATPASALLLIARMLPGRLLRDMAAATREAGLEAVLEVFDKADLERAREALQSVGFLPAIIQVNNRDLQTLKVDEAVSRRLIMEKLEQEIWISASGAERREQIEERAALGFDAVLAGSFLMAGGNPGAALAALTGQGKSG